MQVDDKRRMNDLSSLSQAYAEMAMDQEHECEAFQWSEGLIEDWEKLSEGD